ncbi:MAG: sulfite exporter TauE/SafE family protein [Thermococci archaeon]|nr:sulfite exporter TauE/SafE family protein [Thermococci archaeon]
MISLFNVAKYTGVGLIIGLLAALFGLGGGFLLVPVLSMLGVEIHKAVGTSSAAVVFTSLSSTIAYARQGRIHYKTGLMLAGSAVFGAWIGAWMTSYINSASLKVVFGVALMFVAASMIRGRRGSLNVTELSELKINYKAVPIGGFVSGIISGLLGVGGGIVNVPFLTYLGLPIHYAVATSSFAIVFTATSGAAKHYMLGHVVVKWLVLLVPGLIIGAQLGARIARVTKAKNLKNGFAVIMFLLALRMILKGLGIHVP